MGAKTAAVGRKRARAKPQAGRGAILPGAAFKDCRKRGEPAYVGWLCGAGGRVCANVINETAAACSRCVSGKRNFCVCGGA